jgi:hypothetical protein
MDPTHLKHSRWLVTSGGGGEYKGIIDGTTSMTMQPHSNPNASGEWQIIFSKESTDEPPGVEILHFVEVSAGSDVASLPHSGQSYLAAAYFDIMCGKHNYYGAIGYLDGTPTLALLALRGDTSPREFFLVFVKVKETDSVRVKQGGVLHGHEN